ncbi:MAG TPA: response regulator transcription factor [Beijerinckiaceae bacterium]|nr:response regulator transcription factor [Beijerinckiaceae bacterium]
MSTVAIVEDEDDLREAVVEFLSGRGLRVLAAANAQEFRALIARESVDVAVLDIAMSGEDGRSLARWLTGRPRAPGIIFATAAGRPADRVVGLEIGADDYLVKPYELRELLARIRSLLRRLEERPVHEPPAPAAEAPRPGRQLPVGPYLLDLDSRRLTRDGTSIVLTPAELDLLEALATRPNRVLSRSQLLELAQAGDGGSDRSVDVRITRLRRKLEADPDDPQLIRTVRGEGYVFVPAQGSPAPA